MDNYKLKSAMFKHELRQWQVAKIMGISESLLSKKLRKDLPEEEQD